MPSRKTPFQQKHTIEYGLSVGSICPVTSAVFSVNCEFCRFFNREERIGQKRKPTTVTKMSVAPFRPELYLQHLIHRCRAAIPLSAPQRVWWKLHRIGGAADLPPEYLEKTFRAIAWIPPANAITNFGDAWDLVEKRFPKLCQFAEVWPPSTREPLGSNAISPS